MITAEVIVKIRHLYFAEHWKIGTIASQLGLHYGTVRALGGHPKPAIVATSKPAI